MSIQQPNEFEESEPNAIEASAEAQTVSDEEGTFREPKLCPFVCGGYAAGAAGATYVAASETFGDSATMFDESPNDVNEGGELTDASIETLIEARENTQ